MEDAEESNLTFQDMELDERILKAVARLGWSEPTPVQEAAIPLLLQGKDVLIKARTGSGKTGAFAIPAIQMVLNMKKSTAFNEQCTRVLILAPYIELCGQIAKNISELAVKCSRDVSVVDLSARVDVKAQRPILASGPDIVVTTPIRALLHVQSGALKAKYIDLLIIDEADLVVSFGHSDDLKKLLTELPHANRQTALASATLNEEVKELKALALKRPAILKLEEPDIAPSTQLSHYHIGAEEDEKAVILLVLLKLSLIRGRTLIFVNTVDRCYKIKLFLEQFSISSGVLNSELPASARSHAVSQFNQGVFDLLIASDEKDLDNPAEDHTDDSKKKKKKNKKKKQEDESKQKSQRKKDPECGVSRGIDFQFVSNVINFDFPKDMQPYIHRVGRTARGKNQGTALSFVSVSERAVFEQVKKELEETAGSPIQPFQFKMEEVEGFRYRARDAWRSVTRIAVREARVKEIKQEILNCKKLESYFQENPQDLKSLRCDKKLHAVKLKPHMAHVPDYLVPKSLRGIARGVSKRKRVHEDEESLPGPANKISKAKAKYEARQRNPLLSMEFKGFNKKKK